MRYLFGRVDLVGFAGGGAGRANLVGRTDHGAMATLQISVVNPEFY
jgi:hypothetical protein